MLIDLSGKVIYSQDSGFIESKAHGSVRTFHQHNGVGLINENGEIILPPARFELGWVSEHYLYAMKGDSMGVFDSKGRQVIGFDYLFFDFGKDPNADGGQFILQDRNEKYGVIDTAGRIIIPFIYENIDYAGCEYYHAKTRHFILTLNAEGKTIRRVPARDENGGYSYSISRKEMACNPFPTYYPIPSYQLVEKGSLVGYTDEYGRLVIPPVYESGGNFDENGLAPVYQIINRETGEKRLLGYINDFGRQYWED